MMYIYIIGPVKADTYTSDATTKYYNVIGKQINKRQLSKSFSVLKPSSVAISLYENGI